MHAVLTAQSNTKQTLHSNQKHFFLSGRIIRILLTFKKSQWLSRKQSLCHQSRVGRRPVTLFQTFNFILLPVFITLPTGLLVISTDEETATYSQGLPENVHHHKESIPNTQGIGHQIAYFHKEGVSKGIPLHHIINLSESYNFTQLTKDNAQIIKFIVCDIVRTTDGHGTKSTSLQH
jgi:hypothetical protein